MSIQHLGYRSILQLDHPTLPTTHVTQL